MRMFSTVHALRRYCPCASTVKFYGANLQIKPVFTITCRGYRYNLKLSKSVRKVFLVIVCTAMTAFAAVAQTERVKNQPYADMKLYHLGFHIGLHTQDLMLTNTGITSNGQTLFAEIPSYNPGFCVGVIGDMYLNPHFNLRFTPTLYFGDKSFVFRTRETGEEFKTNVRSNYMAFPLELKYSALRLNNYRPYLTGGVYGALDLGRKKGNPVLLKGRDFGLTLGIGCDLYLPYFKLSPELKFYFGLSNLLETDRSDLPDQNMKIYTDALSKATGRMIILTFNFE